MMKGWDKVVGASRFQNTCRIFFTLSPSGSGVTIVTGSSPARVWKFLLTGCPTVREMGKEDLQTPRVQGQLVTFESHPLAFTKLHNSIAATPRSRGKHRERHPLRAGS